MGATKKRSQNKSENKITRRDFFRTSGRTTLVAGGLIIAGASFSIVSCKEKLPTSPDNIYVTK